MLKAKQNQVWPPEQSSCPDFWDWDESRKKCLNTKQLGNCTGSTDGLDNKCVYPVGEGFLGIQRLFNHQEEHKVIILNVVGQNM